MRIRHHGVPVFVLVLTTLVRPAAARAQVAFDAPSPPSTRIPEPDPAAQKEAEKLIREIHKADYVRRSPQDLRDLARSLLREGLETKDDPAARFVLLREARELAAQGGDAVTAVAAVEEAAKTFAVDAVVLKAAALASAARAARGPNAAKDLAEACLEAADEAAAADRYDLAESLAGRAEAAAKTSQDAALLDRARDGSREVAEAHREYQVFRAAEKTLESKPDDPAACLAVGKFHCFVKDDWAQGLPALARGGDPGLRAAAERETARPADPPSHVAAADAWWDLAEQERNPQWKSRFQNRARHWYEKALPALGGLTKARVENRLQDQDGGSVPGARLVSVSVTRQKDPPPGHQLRARWTTDGGGGRTTDGVTASGTLEFFLHVRSSRSGPPITDVILYSAGPGQTAAVGQPAGYASIGHWDVRGSTDANGTSNAWNVSLCVARGRGTPVRDLQLGEDASWGKKGYVSRGQFDGKTLWIRKP